MHIQSMQTSYMLACKHTAMVVICTLCEIQTASEWRHIFSGARLFSMLRVQVVVVHPFGIFHSSADFLIDASKAFRRSSSGEALTA